ncbi:hypothetical protein E1B28_012574 [Marasmius oreades]|uniref:Calcium/proton exchanger n=1 Tax=Marasmius oreades TaxID=181124 RepID=A0A9P7RSK4_9AGAR|nr:uncharacterized protein E1B28_012574 [Marasmius oreades]KAG7088600.1 hypothetical protein E1B28_012574 [Marasmius oreades]
MSNIPSPTTDDGEDNALSSTPTPHSHLHRSLSHASPWSATETPQHHNQGTSYFPSSLPSSRPNPSPILIRSTSAHSVSRGNRSTSVSSGPRFREDTFSEADEYDSDEERPTNDRSHNKRGKAVAAAEDSDERDDESPPPVDRDEDPITLKERQSLINVEHPFGLPIWKPALYKKSRSITRSADQALHSVPSAQAERHLLPGNLFWVLVFGWWLSLVCFIISAILYVVPRGGREYSRVVFGLGWYLAWPFGKYVEGLSDHIESEEHSNEHERASSESDTRTVRGNEDASTVRATSLAEPSRHVQSVSWNSPSVIDERTTLLPPTSRAVPAKSYGVLQSSASASPSSMGISKENTASLALGKVCFWLALICIIAPLMLVVCLICWGLVVTIPMARLNWALIKHLFEQPDSIRFCAAPPAVVVSTEEPASDTTDSTVVSAQFAVKHRRLTEGQVAPGSSGSAVLLCIYRAMGWKYYKYTVGGVNIMFVNLMVVVFFVIFDWAVFLRWVEELERHGRPVPKLLALVASRGLIFFMGLLSVIPLSYFIGMAVASISAQSSIGMGAVINATFGSIIEILLYSLMLTEGKGHLVEGSIIGSILAGVLLMPGMSMVSSALRRKEQKFNAKSAGVTSMMLIMAIIGALAPTLFYQTYGNFQLVCKGCPSSPGPGKVNKPWVCDQCYYKHPDPVDDPFYQSTVKSFMYFCAFVLLFSYLVGLWFSLRTHASQIWQNPRHLLNPVELPIHNRQSIYQKYIPTSVQSAGHRLTRKASNITGNDGQQYVPQTPSTTREASQQGSSRPASGRPSSPVLPRRVSYAPNLSQSHVPGYTPLLESVDHAVKNTGLQSLQLPETMTTDDFTRAVAVATVSALRHQQTHNQGARRHMDGEVDGGQGGHDAPSWSRSTSASVLLACTALYAVIAEILVDVVDVILSDSGLDEKFLGVTLFALVPNTTEFMNAISFALNGNIALSMEIGSAYALQVCLLQIPAMVAFSAWYAPDKMGLVASTFSLIFPRWDVVVIILSMFLLTYTYIEAKSNYHRGSILILSYLVLTAGFYYAPRESDDNDEPEFFNSTSMQEFTSLTLLEYVRWCLTVWW